MRTTAVLDVTPVLFGTSGIVVLEDHAWRTEARHGAILVVAQMRAAAVIDQAFVDLHARLPVIFEQLVIIRTSALDATLDVCAEMRAATVVLDALVHVLAGPSIGPQSIAVGAATLEAAIRVDAGMRAAVVYLVVRLLAFVPIQAASVVFGQNIAGRAAALKAVLDGDTLVGAAVLTGAKINFLARPSVRA